MTAAERANEFSNGNWERNAVILKVCIFYRTKPQKLPVSTGICK
jgi:hypothetical protein